MRWFVTLIFLSTALLVVQDALGAGQWDPTGAVRAPVPASPWPMPPAMDWPPPPPSAMAPESAEVNALREQVRSLWSALSARDMTVEQLQRHLLATLQQRDHWWLQLRWVWEQARHDQDLAWQRIMELETALAQTHQSGAVMAEQLAGWRRRVQAALGELAQRESRMQALEREQRELRATLGQRTAELEAANGRLNVALEENSRLRADAERHQDRPLEAEKVVLRHQDSARTEEPTLAEIGALETEPDWASHELDQLRKSLSDQVARITVEGRESRVRAPMDELHAMRVDRNYLEARLKEVLAEREALNDSLSAARLSLQQATGEASAQRAELASLREQAAALREKLQGASKRLDGLAGQRDRDEARIGALEAENARLMQRLQAMESAPPVAQFDPKGQTAMAALAKAIAGLEKELSAATSELKAPAGESVDPENVQARAARLGYAYEVVYSAAENSAMSETKLGTGLERLSDDLFMEQSLLARAVAASGVYKVLPRDSLSRISYKVYGTGERWPDIYAANDHLLDNPDSLLPGLVLVIP